MSSTWQEPYLLAWATGYQFEASMPLSKAQHLHMFVEFCLQEFVFINCYQKKSIKTTYKNMKIKHMGIHFGGSLVVVSTNLQP